MRTLRQQVLKGIYYQWGKTSEYEEEEFEDTKRVIRIRKSKKNRQHNGQKKEVKRTNNDLQNITHQTKDRVSRTPLRPGGGTRRATNPVISHEWGRHLDVFTTSGTYPEHNGYI